MGIGGVGHSAVLGFSRAALTAFGVSVLLGCCPLITDAQADSKADAWSDSYDPATKTRFIPVELWTGSPWDGARTINLPRANLTFGGGVKRITGPLDWADPLDGSTRKVYMREHAKERKTQWFAVRDDGTGIGRVNDSRRKEIERGESKFPAGLWTQGEMRTYKIDTYDRATKAKSGKRTQVTIIMENIDHRYDGTDHCLTFRWQRMDRDKIVDNNAYTYCPGKGLASLDDD